MKDLVKILSVIIISLVINKAINRWYDINYRLMRIEGNRLINEVCDGSGTHEMGKVNCN